MNRSAEVKKLIPGSRFWRRLTPFFLLFPAFLFLSGCRKENAFDCLKSTGPIRTETRYLPAFKAIEVKDNVELVLIQDTQARLEVEAGENLLSSIRTDVKNDRLYIENYNKCNWVRSYRKKMQVRLYLPQMPFLAVIHDGESLIRTEGTIQPDTLFLYQNRSGDYDLSLQVTRLWMTNYNLGNMTLRGHAETLNAYTYGLGNVDASQFTSKSCHYHLHGSGNVQVRAVEFLGAFLTGLGNLTYFGNPVATDFSATGSGKIYKGD